MQNGGLTAWFDFDCRPEDGFLNIDKWPTNYRTNCGFMRLSLYVARWLYVDVWTVEKVRKLGPVAHLLLMCSNTTAYSALCPVACATAAAHGPATH